jgi:hypothetical protein
VVIIFVEWKPILWFIGLYIKHIIDGKGVVMKKSKSEDNLRKFKKGDKVKTKYGEIRTVIVEKGVQVLVKEESNSWHHPSNLCLINQS